MADLEFTGSVNFDEAQSSLDAFAGDVQASIDAALAGVDVGSFASSLVSEMADAFASTPLPVEADTTSATAEVSALVSDIDSQNSQITVDADTTAAQSALDELDASAQSVDSTFSGASSGVDRFGLSTGQLAGVAGLAVGEVGGLREASSLLGERTAAATAGVLGLGVGVAALYNAGLQAASAEERFNAALGAQAEAVQRVQVGSLDADLFKLGATFGSADAAMRNATTSVFQFAINSGASRQQAVAFADGIAAISARAVATKPSVGDIADVMDRAAIGIGRARTAASLLNVGLSTTEVNTRAAAIAQANGEASASAYDKSLAALQITVERFGPSLKANVEEGAKNAANQAKAAQAEFDNFLESIAKPLVAPALDAIRAAIPVAEQLGATLADVASVAIPLVSGALTVLGPLIGPIVEGFLALKAAELAAAAVAALAGGIEVLSGVLPVAGAATEAFAGEVAGASIAIESAAGPIGILVGVAALAASQLGLFGGAEESVADQTHKMADELAKLDGAKLISTFEGGATVRALADGVSIATGRLREFRTIAEDNVGTASRLLDALKANGDNTKGYQRILDDAVSSQKRANAAQAESKSTQDELLQSTKDASAATKAQNDLNATAYTSLNDYATGTGTASQALKDLTAAQQNENDALSLYTLQLKTVQGLQGDVTAGQAALTQANQSLFESLVKNGTEFDVNTTAGAANIQALLHARDAADALAEATFKQTGKQSDADAVIQTFTQHLTDTLTGLGLTTGQVTALETQLGLLKSPPPVTVEVDINEITRALSLTPGVGPAYATLPPLGVAAEGAYVPAKPGGSQFTVGEAGSDEVIVSPRDIPSAIANLSRLGVLNKLVPSAPSGSPSAGATAGGVDYSVHVDTIVSPDPEGVPSRIARRQRQMQALAGR